MIVVFDRVLVSPPCAPRVCSARSEGECKVFPPPALHLLCECVCVFYVCAARRSSVLERPLDVSPASVLGPIVCMRARVRLLSRPYRMCVP